MPEQHPFVGGHKVASVIMKLRGSRALVIEGQDLRGDKSRIQPVRDEIATHRRQHEPDRIQRFATLQCDFAQRACAQQCHSKPDQFAQDLVHNPKPSRPRNLSSTNGETINFYCVHLNCVSTVSSTRFNSSSRFPSVDGRILQPVCTAITSYSGNTVKPCPPNPRASHASRSGEFPCGASHHWKPYL